MDFRGTHIVLKTTNAGENWDTLYTTDGNATCAAYFLTNDIGWIINGYFIKTTDAGQSWDTLYTWSAGLYFFQKMYFWNENNGYVNGGYGLLSPDPFLYKTTDGGYSWNPENSPFLSAYYWGISFSFVDDEIGWSASCITHIYNPYRGHISRTEDGGETWERQLTDSCSYSWPHRGFQDVFFINYEKGWVINEDSILYTTDGGENWDFQSTETTELWRSIHFTDENNGWVVGDNGIILHTTTGGVVSVKEEQLDGIPTEYMLAQNFPNPFNPSTTVQYSIKERTPVELVLYDILGRVVEVLVNEEQDAGYYKVNFNAGNLASGIYLYRLKAGSFIETKKMLLIK